MDIDQPDLPKIFINKIPLIDVRAPIEFKQGSLPNSTNLPLLNDEERALVGTTYKKEGKDAAIALGHQLVSGPIKASRVQAWIDFLNKNPDAVIYCFRGGLRSRTTQAWLKQLGYSRPLIVGGYKRTRNYLMSVIEKYSEENQFLVLSGTTGNGKTHLITEAAQFFPTIDLEALARHKGSAFGGFFAVQPTQIDFENNLAQSILTIEDQFKQNRILIEDESRLIGRCALPEKFFIKQRASSVLLLDEPIECRVENIFKDYILDTAIGKNQPQEASSLFEKYLNSVKAISKKLGGVRTEELIKDIQLSMNDYHFKNDLDSNRVWIKKLLLYYYDPLYLGSLEKRSPKVLFRGRRQEILDWLKQN